MDPGAIVGFSILGVFILVTGMVFILAGPVGKALARRIEGRASLPPEIPELEARLADADALRQRVAELEERLDYAERLLTQAREPARLPDPEARR
jgi:hypothetical protein